MTTSLQWIQSHYLKQLSDLLSAEEKLVRALPRAIESAGSEEMQRALNEHLKETEEHVLRLERVLGAYCCASNFARPDGNPGAPSFSFPRPRTLATPTSTLTKPTSPHAARS